ncbi:hypothetical protein PFISCL1PPCAC_23469, partial [Pristionchus fissidentatus]
RMAEPTLVASSIIPSLPRSERGRPASIHVSSQNDLFVFPSAKVVNLLQVSDLSVVHIFRDHRFDTTGVRFSPNGQLVASGDCGGELFVWEAAAPFAMKYKHTIGGEIANIAWSPDGSKIAVVGDGRPVYFDLKTSSSGADLTCHSRRIESIAIHPIEKTKLILMASHDSRVSVFDNSNGGYRPKYSQLLTVHNKEVYSVCFNDDGSLFASGGADGRIAVYETATKTKIAERQHDRSITSTVFLSVPCLDSSSGDAAEDIKQTRELLVYASTDGTIRALGVPDAELRDENGQWEELVEEWEVKDHGSTVSQRLALSASSAAGCILAVNSNGRLDKLCASSGSLLASLNGHKGHLKAIDIENEVVVTGDNTGRLCIDRGSGVEPFGVENNMAIRGVSILPSEGVVLSFRVNNQMECVSLSDGAVLFSSPLPSEPRSISKGRDTVAVLCHKHLLMVCRKTRAIVLEQELSMDPTAISLHMDGSEVAVGDATGAVTVYSVTDSTLCVTQTLKVKRAVSAMAYSADCSHLAVADSSRYVSVYDRANWSLMADDWRMHNASIKTLAWSPDGNNLATGAVDRSLIVWALPVGDKKRDPIVQKSGHIPEALKWLSSKEVVTVGEDGCRIHWRLE